MTFDFSLKICIWDEFENKRIEAHGKYRLSRGIVALLPSRDAITNQKDMTRGRVAYATTEDILAVLYDLVGTCIE